MSRTRQQSKSTAALSGVHIVKLLVLVMSYLVASLMPNVPNGTKEYATNTAVSYLVALTNILI